MPKHLYLDEEQLDYLVIFLESGIEDSHGLTVEHPALSEEHEHGKDGLRVARAMLKMIDRDNPLLKEKIRAGVPFDFEALFKRIEDEDEDEDESDEESNTENVVEVEVETITEDDEYPAPEVVVVNERTESPR